MHMADALLSPEVGGTMWAASAGTIAYCSAKVRRELDDRKVPLMGVLGAFLFAAQMINFTIPGTGSSGHLGGGLLLTILLGPYAAFLTIASVLVVQALFFADGGLLALGCNIINMGFFPAFIVYPLIYKRLIGTNPSRGRLTAVTILSAMIGLQLGPLGVVLETVFSGISSLPFSTFVLLMLPIHLAIGAVEGLITVAIVSFVQQARPDILQSIQEARPVGNRGVRRLVFAFLAAAVLTGGIVSWFASERPDGLEWAIQKVTGRTELATSHEKVHQALAALQEKTAILPDYGFKAQAKPEGAYAGAPAASTARGQSSEGRIGTSISGLIGALLTLGIAFLSGYLLKRRNQRA